MIRLVAIVAVIVGSLYVRPRRLRRRHPPRHPTAASIKDDWRNCFGKARNSTIAHCPEFARCDFAG